MAGPQIAEQRLEIFGAGSRRRNGTVSGVHRLGPG